MAATASVLALVLGATACGGGPTMADRPAPTTTVSTATTPTTGPTTSPTAGPVAAFECNDRRSGGGDGFGALGAVRVGTHDGYDRITFEFAEALPAYTVQPAVAPLTLDPSDLPLTLDGEAFLDIVFRNASARYSFAVSEGQVGAPPYEGADRVTPHFEVLREAAMRGDFEAVLIWTLGASRSTCLRVLELQSPPRLVIDLSHQPA